MTRVAAFYRFTPVSNPTQTAARIWAEGTRVALLGTVLVAPEGINSTLCGNPEAVAEFFQWLGQEPGFDRLTIKFSDTDAPPFQRWKVKVKEEIVSMGVPGVDPNSLVGTYVPPAEWNQLISRPDVLLIDCRNSYEFEVGTFVGAIDPETDEFNEFPEYASRIAKDPRPVALFCTGGIRCEKATSYLRSLGHGNVYHLEGGILRYLEEIPESESLFRGDCFVFDGREALDHSLMPAD